MLADKKRPRLINEAANLAREFGNSETTKTSGHIARVVLARGYPDETAAVAWLREFSDQDVESMVAARSRFIPRRVIDAVGTLSLARARENALSHVVMFYGESVKYLELAASAFRIKPYDYGYMQQISLQMTLHTENMDLLHGGLPDPYVVRRHLNSQLPLLKIV